jgi:putative addiction module component (TIGR02574 family)
MTTSIIRQKLHNYLEVADDKKIKAIYAIMEVDVEEKALIYSDEIRADLDSRLAKYEADKTDIISADESKQRILSLMKKAAKK